MTFVCPRSKKDRGSFYLGSRELRNLRNLRNSLSEIADCRRDRNVTGKINWLDGNGKFFHELVKQFCGVAVVCRLPAELFVFKWRDDAF